MRKLAFLLFTLVATAWVGATAETIYFNHNEFDVIPAAEHKEFTISKEGITITVSDGCIYGSFRIYKDNTMTVTSTAGNITKISVYSETAYDEKYGAGNFTCEQGTYAQMEEGSKCGVWTPGSTAQSEVVLTTSIAQVRATDINVEVEEPLSIIRSHLNLGYYTATGKQKITSIVLSQQSENVFTGELVPGSLLEVVLPVVFQGVGAEQFYIDVTGVNSPMPGSIENLSWGGVSDTGTAPSIVVGSNEMKLDGTPWNIITLMNTFGTDDEALQTPVAITADFNRKVLILGLETLKGDINGDGSVDGNDVSILLEMVLAGGVSAEQTAVADINGDTSVDGNDVSILLEMVLAGTGN